MPEVEDLSDLFFYRPLAFLLVKLVYRTSITPNQLTITALFLGIVSASYYAEGTPTGFVGGAILFILYNIFDCSDGQLARLKHNGTHAGRIIDGIADYIATLAVFIGIGFGFANHQENPAYWWFLILLMALSSVVQAILVDYYRNRFLDNVFQRKSTFEEELESYRIEYNVLKDLEGKWLERAIIKIYLRYCDIQEKIIPREKKQDLFNVTPEEYYKKNKLIMRLWTLICSSAEITVLVICSFLNRLDLFIWIILIGFNGMCLILWPIQRSIDTSLKKA